MISLTNFGGKQCVFLAILLVLSSITAQAQNNTTFNAGKGTWEFNPWSTQNVMIRQMERSGTTFGGYSGGVYTRKITPRQLATAWSNTFNKIMQVGSSTRKTRGRDVIKRNRAVTTFTATGTPVLVKYFQGDSLEERAASDYLPQSLELHKKFLRSVKLTTNDVTDNFVLGVETYYLIYMGKFNDYLANKPISEFNATQRKSLQNQIKQVLLKSEDFQGLSDEQKQSIHEIFSIAVVNAMVDTNSAFKSKDTKKMQILRTAAGLALQQLTGIPAIKIKMTNDGISSK
jgi:hypothetical protein